MATNFDQSEESNNPFARLIKNSLILAPIGIAGWNTFREVGSNAAINPVAAAGATATRGRLGRTGEAVGKKLLDADKQSRVKLINHAKEVIEEITKSSDLSKVWQTIASQEAVMQSLMDVLQDPSMGLPEGVIAQYRQQLADVMAESIKGDEAEEIVRNALRAINGHNSDTVRARFGANMRQYSGIAAQLEPPSTEFRVTRPVNVVDPTKMSSTARERWNYMSERLGTGSQRHMQAVQYDNQFYARMYSGRPGNSRFLGLIPLDLASTGKPYVQMRMNENLTTGYGTDRYFLDAQEANKLMNQKDINADKLFKKKGRGGAAIDIEDLFMNEFLGSVKSSEGRLYLNRNRFGEFQRQFMSTDWRIATSGEPVGAAKGFVQHLQRAGAFQHNYAQFVNFGDMNLKAQRNLVKRAATVPGMEASASANRILGRDISDEPMGTVGIYKGSALEALETAGLQAIRNTRKGNHIAERGLFPVTSRIEQVVGRESMFISGEPIRWMGRGNNFTAGPRARWNGGEIDPFAGKNVEWSGSLTGATNKTFLLNVLKDGPLGGLKGSGTAYWRGTEDMLTPFTKPIVEPLTRGSLGSRFLNEVIAGQDPSNLIRLTPDQMKEYQNFLGIGPSGLQHLKQDPRTKDYFVKYSVTENQQKRHINLQGFTRRGMEAFKGFSLAHKGTFQQITEADEIALVGQDIINTLEGLGVTQQDRAFAYGDMFKKGLGFYDAQVTGAVGLITGRENFKQEMAGAMTRAQYGLPDNHLGKLATAAITMLKDTKVNQASEVGMALAALYHSGSSHMQGDEGISREAMANALKQAGYAAKHREKIIAVAEMGNALFPTSVTAGTGHGDFALGRGSVEPRFMNAMVHRLRRMGMSEGEASDFLAEVYKNKIGYAGHIKSASGLMQLAESVKGNMGALDVAQMLKEGVPSYGVHQISELLPPRGNAAAILNKHTKGFLLDLTEGADTQGQHTLANAARTVFGQGQVRIPGTEVLHAMGDTVIKTTDGSIHVQDEYSRMIGHFLEDINTISSSQDYDRAVTLMRDFQKEVVDMTAKTVHTVAGGKIKGMQAAVAHIYDLTTFSGMGGKGNLAYDIFKHTKGRAVFMDTKAFTSQLKDFMSGTLSKKDAAKRAEMFFTSLEGSGDVIGRAKGIYGLSMRHPLLSVGNVAATEIYRHLGDVGQGTGDDAWQRFLASGYKDAKNRTMADKYGKLGGFQSLMGGDKETTKLRKRFFKDFVSSLDDWAGMEGGGSVYIPRRLEEFHYTGHDKALQVDIGISGAAIGDWDGDQWYTMMSNQKMGKSIDSTLRKGAEADKYLTADVIYKIKSEIYTEEAKKGLKRVGSSRTLTAEEVIQEGILKESASKQAVGGLDVQLNRMRMAVLNRDMSDPRIAAKAEESMAMLKVIQEHAVIKGKKVPVYRDFAGMLVSGIRDAFGGDISSFRETLETKIFPGSELVGGGVQLTGMNAGTGGRAAPDFVKNAYSEMSSQRMMLADTVDFLQESINMARNTGVADVPSIGQLTKLMNSNDPLKMQQAFDVIRGMQTPSAGMVGAARQPMMAAADTAGAVMSNIRAAAGRLDKRTSGVLAMGGMVALGMAGAVGDHGYAADPLVMPGESVSGRVRSGIASGEALRARRDPQISPEGMGPHHNAYAMGQNPINQGTMYANKQNSYQVRGEVYGTRGLRYLNDYLGNMGGAGYGGSVRISDNRQAITPNYLDRLMGEY